MLQIGQEAKRENKDKESRTNKSIGGEEKERKRSETEGQTDAHEIMMDPDKMMEKSKMEETKNLEQSLTEKGHSETGHMDNGPMHKGHMDVGPMDEGPMDNGPMDAGPMDKGQMDVGPMDEGPMDKGHMDKGPMDKLHKDNGPMDKGHMDNGPMDKGHIMDEGHLRTGKELLGDGQLGVGHGDKGQPEMSEEDRKEKLDNFEKGLVRKIKLSDRDSDKSTDERQREGRSDPTINDTTEQKEVNDNVA